MGVIHISDSDAEHTFARLLAEVRSGSVVLIEHDNLPIARLQGVADASLVSEALAQDVPPGPDAVYDDGFASDVDAARKAMRQPARDMWE